MNLYRVTIGRTYTQLGKDIWGQEYSASKVVSWGENIEEVQEYWNKIHSREDDYWDARFKDKVEMIDQISEAELAEMRLMAHRYSCCCELAVLRNCVCSYSTTCPVHGSRCHGSHD